MFKRLSVRSSLIAVASSVSLAAYAYADAPTQINIPAGDLIAALESLSKQVDVELVYQAEQLKGLHTPGVSGTLSTQDAVKKLLEGTKLRLRTDESTGAMLIALPTPAVPKHHATSTPNTLTEGAQENTQSAAPSGFLNRMHLAEATASPIASATDATAGGGAAPPELAEIVITGNKREERLQSVTASVVAVTADTLETQQIREIKDIQQLAPSLNFQSGDEARLFNFSIRGVGSEAFSVGVEPSVATIVDGVVYTRPAAVFDGLVDLERVEVLNGPQGMLQGKNASAGAVVIVTKKPNRDAFEGKVEYTAAQGNDHNVSLMLTGPINDKLAYRGFGYYKRADGQVTNIATGKTVNNVEGYGFRGKLEYEPMDGINLLLSADDTNRKSACCGEPIRVPAKSGNVTAAFTGAAVGPDSTQVNFDTALDGHQDNRGVSLEGNIKVSDLTLTSLSAYRYFEDFAIRDRDGTNAPFTGVTAQQLFEATHPGISEADATVLLQQLLVNPLSFACRGNVCGESDDLEKNGTFTQELRLASPSGGLFDYLLGLYYYDSRVERDATIGGVRTDIPGNVAFSGNTVTVLRPTAYVLADLRTKVDTIDKAVFGNFNFRPVDRLTLTAGFRALHDSLVWNHNKVTGPNGDHIGGGIGTNPEGQVAPGANVGTPSFHFIREFTSNALIGKVSVKYEFTRDLMAYTSWGRGYKGEAVDADIFTTQAGVNNSPVAPEKSRSWEVGFRSSWLERRVLFNTTWYDTLFNGYQTASTGTDGSGAPVLRSAGQLFTKGVDAEAGVRPIDSLTLSANAEFNHATFGDLFVTPTLNVKGGVPLDAPKRKYGATATYKFALANWETALAANYTYVSSTLFTNLADANNPNSPWIRPAYDLVNTNLGFTSPNEKYSANFFVKNVFDNHYVGSLRRISGSVGGAGAVAQSIPRDFDRYFGVTLSAKF